VATKIKLQRLGKMREPHYRIVVADARTKRDGRYIEAIGQYHPKSNPSVITVDAERAAYWLAVGAQPTESVQRILGVTGDWQKFKGLPAPAPMLVAAAKTPKGEIFAEAAKVAAGIEDKPAVTPRTRKAPEKKTDTSSAVEASAADAPGVEIAAEVAQEAAEAPAAETTEAAAETTEAAAE
jgi:small subunit ribosomal protein S16